ncbi:cell cycle regulator of non-homologous end joining-like isoform X2 [Polyodon spathula]|uniref:cell cycle regulator of non-homologous end joining-like isoform X2 n=1 Tax=Polyodon spathula TaxID=7913 RepID=UPI001B7E3042|nr:cell cycle regulator of non-homologous end joining-like isoform X2 [Polyodon spathula]
MEPRDAEGKRRLLPGWMVRWSGEKKVDRPTEGSAKITTSAKRGERKTVESIVTVYCMNEAELVNAAFDLLATGSSESKHPGFGVTTGDSIREKNMWISESELEDGDTDSEPIQKTCISESNLVVDNTSPAHHTKQKRVDSTVPKRKDITQVSELNACERTVEQAHVDRTDPGDAEDDAFKLVREIFFTS